MVNKVTLIGRLGADPDIRTLENGVQVGRFSVATSDNYRDKAGEWQEQTEWHDVVVWRQAAERAQRSLFKGTLLYVEGKLTHRKWQDKDGNNRKTTEVVASYFRIINRPGDHQVAASNYGGHEQYAGQPTAAAQPAPAPEVSAVATNSTPTAPATPPSGANGADSFDDGGEDLPF